MIYYCILAVLIVYYIFYTLLLKKQKYGYAIALIPAVIFVVVFWWLTQFRYYEALLFILYGMGFLIVLVSSVIWIKERQFTMATCSLIPFVLSVFLFLWYGSVNFFNSEICDESNGCMNETGLLMLFSINLMVIAFIFTTIFFIADKYAKRNRINNWYTCMKRLKIHILTIFFGTTWKIQITTFTRKGMNHDRFHNG